MKFIITLDTEGDNQWDHGRDLTTENIRYIPRFQNLCEQYHIKPTYLVTSEICGDGFSNEIFSEYLSKDNAEIGAHLHSWTTPPFMNDDGFRSNDINHAFAHELPEFLLSEKIKVLTGQIENSFGKKPKSFRSGRYGFNRTVARILSENEYIVDSSLTPFVNWKANKGIPDGQGGPDFINCSPFPFKYIFALNSLTEIPITILPTRFPLNRNWELARYHFKNTENYFLFKFLRKYVFDDQPLWLRPQIWTTTGHLNDLVAESERIGLPYMVMMFHTSELMPGCSIYRTDKESVEKLYDLLEVFFITLQSRNIKSVTLTEAAEDFDL